MKKRNIITGLMILFCCTKLTAQNFLNSNFDSNSDYWLATGCEVETGTEDLYNSSLPSSNNIVAEIDSQNKLCQEVSCFIIGQQYTISLLATRRDNCFGSPQDAPDPVEVLVEVDGGALSSSIVRTGSYNLNQPYSVTFTATQNTHIISFYANQTESCGMVLDDFLITKEYFGFNNGDLELGLDSWNSSSCPSEINIEELYDDLATVNNNMVAEIDSQNGLCQSVNNFMIGQDYTISFLASRRNNCAGSFNDSPDPMQVFISVDGGALFDSVIRTGVYNLNQPYSITFTATQNTHLISLYANQSESCGMIIDDLSIITKGESCNVFKRDTILCLNDSLVLNAYQPNSTYLWQDNSTDPIYTVTEEGVFYVEIISESGCICYDTIVVNYDSNCALGLESLKDKDEIVVYPIPSSDFIHFNKFTYSKLTILSLDGKEVKNYKINLDEKAKPTIDISQFENGMYIILVIDENGKNDHIRIIKN